MKKETLLWKDVENKYLEQYPMLSGTIFHDVCTWLEENGYKIKITRKVR